MSSLARLRRLAHRRIGRRGASLLFFGVLDMVYAWSLISADRDTVLTNVTYRWFATIAPLQAWAVYFAVVGAICFYHAFQRHDRFGFVAAVGLKVTWGLLSLVGAFLDDVTKGSVAVWLGLTALATVIAGWREPEDVGEEPEA